MQRLRRRLRKESPRALIFFAFVALVTVGIVYNAISAFLRSRTYQEEYEDVASRIENKKAEIAALEEKLEMLASGEGLELEARARLNLQRPDEHVLIIVDDRASGEGSAETHQSLWKRIIGWFRTN